MKKEYYTGKIPDGTFRDYFKHSRDIFFRIRTGVESVCEYMSPSVKAVTGYPPEKFFGDVRFFADAVHPGDRETSDAFLDDPAAFDGRCFEIRLVGDDGCHIPLEIGVAAIPGVNGEITAVECVAREISRRKRSESNPDENELLLLEIIDMNSIPTIVIDRNHRVTHWNKACEILTGFPRDSIVGTDRQWKAFYTKKRPIMADLILDSTPRDEILNLYPDTAQLTYPDASVYEAEGFFPGLGPNGRWLFITAAPLRDSHGVIVGAVETLQDITERKRAEEALKEQLILLRTLIDTIPNPVFYKDVNGGFLGCNKAYSDFIGVSPADIVGKTAYDIAPSALAEEYTAIDSYLLKHPGVQSYDAQYPHVDGSVRNILVNKATFARSDGALAGIVGVLNDLTENRKLEEQLRQAQKMEAVGTLAAGIAHDFNNILATILMNAELVLLDKPPDSENREELDQIIRSTYRAKDLVNQILTFSRQTKQVMKPIDIAPIVKESLKMLGASIPSTIEIRSSIDSRCGTINGNPIQIQQILMNLCGNAAHAMKEYGGILDVRLEAVRIDSGSRERYGNLPSGDYVRLSVKDTGQGIDDSIADQVFDPFFTTKPTGEGSGLGLAVVHGIAKSHNGSVTFRSVPGQGTIFNVLFPAVGLSENDMNDAMTDVTPTGSERILVVDDEEELVGVMSKILAELNYSVVAKTNSIEALVEFRAHPDMFDLVVTDLTMPRISGVDLASRMKEIRPDIPILLCTGYNEGESALNNGSVIDDLLRKPFSRVEFANKIRSILTRGHDRGE